MTASTISKKRFTNQHIRGNKFDSAKELVQWMGAIQAQDYNMAKWAIGIRLQNATNKLVEEAINNGEIVRTHVLRPTWHFVAAQDIRWMMELTGKNLSRSLSSQNKILELDEKVFKKSNAIIEKLLRNGKHRTRKEIMTALEKKGIKTNSLRAAHIMFKAEIEMIVCNGIKKDKEFTYALFDERVASSKKLLKEEALAVLALRYFQSHGPATLQDFTWWSGLSITDSREALELIKPKLVSEKFQEHLYWFFDDLIAEKNKVSEMVFLPAFDEFLISYKSREISLDPMFASKSYTTNGIFNPIIVHNAKVLGTWKPQYKKEILIEKQFFGKPTEKQKQLLKKAEKNFIRFYTDM